MNIIRIIDPLCFYHYPFSSKSSNVLTLFKVLFYLVECFVVILFATFVVLREPSIFFSLTNGNKMDFLTRDSDNNGILLEKNITICK